MRVRGSEKRTLADRRFLKIPKVMTSEQANSIYFKLYAGTVRKFGHEKTTSTMELNLIGKRLLGNKFLGSFSQDKLPKKIYTKPSYYAILNVDTSGMPGSHWVAIAGLANSKKIMVFDSFGRMTKKLLPLVYKSAKKGGLIDTGYDKEQKMLQDSCGQFSITWLRFFDKYGSKNARKI